MKVGFLCSLVCAMAACKVQSSSESSQISRLPGQSGQPTELEPQPRPFIFSIRLDDARSVIKGNTFVSIITGEGDFNYDVDWNNNGTYDDTKLTNSIRLDYKKPGTYTFRIRGQFPHMLAKESKRDSNLCGMKVVQWGDIQWKSMKRMFKGCDEVASIFPDKEAPDLSHVTDMSEMFLLASSFNQPLDHWNTENVTDMSRMFSYAKSFNQPLNSWNTENVKNMSGMFNHATSFNQPLDSWNVSNVTQMRYMFTSASAFDQPLDSWDTKNVTDMNQMFFKASVFNQPLDSWNTENVKNMSGMFNHAKSFNQPLDSWNTKNVTDMSGMFWSAKSFNHPLNSWDTKNVTDMSDMFNYAKSFNQPLNAWNTSSVTDMSHMFYQASAFNQPLNAWNITNVTNMEGMLDGCSMDTKNYDATLQGWAKQLPMPPRQFGAKGLTYCKAAKARQQLIDAGWTIEGDSKKCK